MIAGDRLLLARQRLGIRALLSWRGWLPQRVSDVVGQTAPAKQARPTSRRSPQQEGPALECAGHCARGRKRRAARAGRWCHPGCHFRRARLAASRVTHTSMSRVADACESSGCGVGGASLFARRPPHGWEALPAVQHICISWGVAEIRQEKAEHSVSEVWSPIPDFCARVTLSEPSIVCAAQCPHLRPRATSPAFGPAGRSFSIRLTSPGSNLTRSARPPRTSRETVGRPPDP